MLRYIYATLMTAVNTEVARWCVCRRLSTTTVERWSLQSRSSLTPTPTSCPRWSRSYSTRCSSRATTSSKRARSAPRCTSFRRALSTSSPRPAKWPPVCRTAPTSEVARLSLILSSVCRDHCAPVCCLTTATATVLAIPSPYASFMFFVFFCIPCTVYMSAFYVSDSISGARVLLSLILNK